MKEINNLKEYNNQVMKFILSDEELKMSIKVKDLIWLFHNSPENFDGEGIAVKVKKGREKEFAEHILRYLMDYGNPDSNNINWSVPFENAFQEVLEGAEDNICEYSEWYWLQNYKYKIEKVNIWKYCYCCL